MRFSPIRGAVGFFTRLLLGRLTAVAAALATLAAGSGSGPERALPVVGRALVVVATATSITRDAFAGAPLCGDANGDRDVTVTDGVLVLRAAAGLAGACQPAACDVDGNGDVTVTDGVNVLREAAGLSSSCPRAIPAIAIDGLETGDSTVRGHVENVDPEDTFVVGWAKTNRYYVQPFLDAPLTTIESDGSWEYFTHPWQQVVVLLVDRSYVVPEGAGIDYHPKTDPGVLAFAEVPASAAIAFSGRVWNIKASAPFPTGPGPCVFSAENVQVDAAGQAHLLIAEREGVWTCAEFVLDRPLGFGAYVFQLATAVDDLGTPTVFAGFLFESLTRELDIEFSRTLASPHGAQFVVQPFTTAGNLTRFDMPSDLQTSHRILWRSDRIEFASWKGWGPFPPAAADLVATFTYTGPDIPPPSHERMRFNLWLVNGAAPTSGRGAEVVVHSFTHTAN